MNARIITIGDEILIGQIVDTNSAFISSLLENNGVKIDSIVSISDTKEAISSAIKESISKFNITITTGGLGPTKDDITKSVLAEIFNCPQQLHEESLKTIEKLLGERGIVVNELNYSQAVLPTAATVIQNMNGTAPALLFEQEDRLLFNLPGVPHEMKALMTDHVVKIIRDRFTLPFITHKTAITFGIPESILAERIESWEDSLPEEVKLAYLPSPSGVKLRLTHRSERENGEAIVKDEFEKLEKIIGSNIAGYDDNSSIQSTIADILTKKGATLTTAESCTGGKIASLFTEMAGASEYFLGGVVSYSNEVKKSALGVKSSTLEQFGAVSKECAIEMAEGVRERFNSDYAVATTGIAGPTGESKDKPVGTLWIAVASKKRSVTKLYNGGNLRDVNIARFCSNAILLLRDLILEEN